jgi:putative DNA primase/helicase
MSDPREQFRSALEAVLGAAPSDIEYGRRHRFSTSGKRSDLSGWCLLFDERGGVYGCWRQGISETWTAQPQDKMTPAERAALRAQIAKAKAEREAEQRAQWRKNRDRIEYVRRHSLPVTEGDPVWRYLCNRLALQSIAPPACLRYAPEALYTHEGESLGYFPAMLAPLLDRTGALLTWHRTYLSLDGGKANVPGPAKKLMPAAGLLGGSCIPLYEPQADTLGIAEGIETALASCLASGVPVVASYSANNLAAWKWPAVRRIVVFADADAPDARGRRAGQEAAEALRKRATAAGLKCEVMTPSIEGQDWADVFASRDQTENNQ